MAHRAPHPRISGGIRVTEQFDSLFIGIVFAPLLYAAQGVSPKYCHPLTRGA